MTAKIVKAEALSETVSFEYDGETFTVGNDAQDWDLEVLEAFEDGKIVAAVRGLLGPDGWAQFKSKPRTVRDLNAFFETAAEALGLGN